MCSGFLGGLDDLAFVGVLLAECDVFPDGSALEPGLLQNHTEGIAQRASSDCACRHAGNKDRAAVRLVKSHQQIDKCRLSASGRSYDCHARVRLDAQAEIGDQGPILLIGKAHVIKFHASVRIVERQGVFGIGSLGGLSQKVINSVGRCDGRLNLSRHRGDIVDWLSKGS